jgi:hypothetical protein
VLELLARVHRARVSPVVERRVLVTRVRVGHVRLALVRPAPVRPVLVRVVPVVTNAVMVGPPIVPRNDPAVAPMIVAVIPDAVTIGAMIAAMAPVPIDVTIDVPIDVPIHVTVDVVVIPAAERVTAGATIVAVVLPVLDLGGCRLVRSVTTSANRKTRPNVDAPQSVPVGLDRCAKVSNRRQWNACRKCGSTKVRCARPHCRQPNVAESRGRLRSVVRPSALASSLPMSPPRSTTFSNPVERPA